MSSQAAPTAVAWPRPLRGSGTPELIIWEAAARWRGAVSTVMTVLGRSSLKSRPLKFLERRVASFYRLSKPRLTDLWGTVKLFGYGRVAARDPARHTDGYARAAT